MRKISCTFLAVFTLVMLTVALADVPADPHYMSNPMTEDASAGVVGASWSSFFLGVACGAGIVVIVSGGLSGVGAPAAFFAVTGVVATCASAFS